MPNHTISHKLKLNTDIKMRETYQYHVMKIVKKYTNYFIELPRFSVETEHLLQINIPAIGTIFPLENFGVKTMTVILVWILSVINSGGAKISEDKISHIQDLDQFYIPLEI